MIPMRRILRSVVPAMVLLSGCGGRVDAGSPSSDPATDAAGDSGPPEEAGISIDASEPPYGDGRCPPSLPTHGGACKDDGAPYSSGLCSFGDEVLPRCRAFASCTGGTWTTHHGCSSTAACPEAIPEVGTPCDPDEVGSCGFVDGTICECDVHASTWVCAAPPTDPRCPTLAPNAGTSCGASGVECAYGVVRRCGDGVRAVCREGSWEWLSDCTE